ncbi:MAG: hypothetical protein C0621_00795 [Desulfuromonas sp.]|nr:MAG: hypothetical protein C0621_00795 [Desulfuromonas sp.]
MRNLLLTADTTTPTAIPFETLSVPTLGFWSLAFCMASLHLMLALQVAIPSSIFALIMLNGGVVQIFTGLLAWRKGQAIASVALISLGLFWLSLLGQLSLPAAGFGAPPSANDLAAYFMIWSIFTLFLAQSARQIRCMLFSPLLLLSLSLLLLAVGQVVSSPLLPYVAAVTGLAGSGIALILPVFERG